MKMSIEGQQFLDLHKKMQKMKKLFVFKELKS
jgi:hypothetical protein